MVEHLSNSQVLGSMILHTSVEVIIILFKVYFNLAYEIFLYTLPVLFYCYCRQGLFTEPGFNFPERQEDREEV